MNHRRIGLMRCREMPNRQRIYLSMLLVALLAIANLHNIVSAYFLNRAAILASRGFDSGGIGMPHQRNLPILRIAAPVGDDSYITAAAADAMKALQWDPGNGRAYYLLGELRAAQGNLLDALQASSIAHSLGAREPLSSFRLAALYNAMGEQKQALNYWREGKGDAVFTSSGWSSFHGDDLESALEYFKLALKINPRNGRALLGLGEIHYARQEWHKAIRAYERALHQGRVSCDQRDLHLAHLRMGLILSEHIGDRAEAIEHFEVAITLDPSDVWAYIRLGEALAHLGQHEKAVHWYNRAGQVQSHIGLTFLGRDALERGDLDAAINYLLEALQQEEGNDMAHRVLGLVYRQKGDLDRAITELQRARELAPHNEWIHMNLGDIYLERGEGEKALQAYQRALSLDPSLAFAAERIDYLKELLQAP